MVAKTYSTDPAFKLRDRLTELRDDLDPAFVLNDLSFLEALTACIQRGSSSRDILNSAENGLIRESWDTCVEALKKAIDLARALNKISIQGINFFRIADRKIAEIWPQLNSLDMMQQLGVIPPMGKK